MVLFVLMIDFTQTGQRRSEELVANTKVFQKMDGHLMNQSLPGCDSFKFKSDSYYDCFGK